MDARVLFALKQGPRSLENHIKEFLACAHYSNLLDIILIDIFCDGIRQPLQTQLRREGPRSSLSCFLEFALLTAGSPFPGGVVDEVRDTASCHKMAADPKPHTRPAKPESPARMATTPADAPLWPGLITSVLDPPLVSVRAAGIPRFVAEPAPIRELTESAPEPAPIRELTESAPEPAPIRALTESAPEPAPIRELSRVRSRARSDPGARRVRSRARSDPGAHRVRSRGRSDPGAHRVRSRGRPDPGAHRVRSRGRSDPRAHRVRLSFVSAGPAQLSFVSAGPAQLAFAAGPAQLSFVSTGPAQLNNASAGSIQFYRAPKRVRAT